MPQPLDESAEPPENRGGRPGFGPIGMPGSNRVPIRRDVFAECTADGLRLVSTGEVVSPADLRFDPESDAPLAAAVRRHARSWGRAGTTFRWQPALVCFVRPDGLETYYAARFALVGSGIPIEQRLVGDDEPIGTERLVPGEVPLGGRGGH